MRVWPWLVSSRVTFFAVGGLNELSNLVIDPSFPQDIKSIRPKRVSRWAMVLSANRVMLPVYFAFSTLDILILAVKCDTHNFNHTTVMSKRSKLALSMGYKVDESV